MPESKRVVHPTATGIDRPTTPDFERVIVVGAGPAGAGPRSSWPRRAPRSACSTRAVPGSKNMYGGVIYGRSSTTLIPAAGGRRTDPAVGHPARRDRHDRDPGPHGRLPHRELGRGAYNGATAYRPDFDCWLADQAVAAGAMLVRQHDHDHGLLPRPAGRVVGVRTDRPDGDLTARLVIACDGVNSFLAKEAGLYPKRGSAELHARA